MRIAVALLSQTFNIFDRQDLTWLWMWRFILVISSLALAGSYLLAPVIALTYVQNEHDRRLREYVSAYVVCPTRCMPHAHTWTCLVDGDGRRP